MRVKINILLANVLGKRVGRVRDVIKRVTGSAKREMKFEGRDEVRSAR